MGKRKRFLYCESQEGGRETFFVYGEEELEKELYRWMHDSVTKEDGRLLRWMVTAGVGDFHYHRLGVCIRVAD